MCGINGITESNHELVLRMNAVTRSRGPDGTHVRTFSACTLGHNRLSIIDTSDNASQPMTTPDGRYTIVFNGEIYNFQELRKELEKTYVFTSKGDTEVLLAGFSVWGNAVLPRLRGIFAFAVWDEKEQTLTAARDQLGVKPFYYATQSGKLLFSSELKGVLEGMRERTLNQAALALYLGIQYVPSPDTLVEGVKKLPPGHLFTYKDGVLTMTRYYVPSKPSHGERADLYTTIDAAVKRQLISDRPIGMFLSGGLDSSIVLHHMKRYRAEPYTFTARFEIPKGFEYQETQFNRDAELAQKTSDSYGTKHIPLTISLSEVREVICNELTNFDEPIANPTAVSQYLLSKKTREHVVVALSGDGGDELFCGYPRHRTIRLVDMLKRMGLSRIGAHWYPKVQLPLGPLFHTAIMAGKESVLSRVLQQKDWRQTPVEDFFASHYHAVESQSPLDAYMRVDRSTWLPDESLLKLDKVSMAHGLEVRVPLLDVDLVSLADTIPATRKMPFWYLWKAKFGKKLLRDAYQHHLPMHVLTPEKRGWISPGAKWLRDEKIAAFAREVFSKEYYDGLSSVIDFNAVQIMLEEHNAQKGYYLLPLWNILLLQIWARHHAISV